ncbi:MAG: hypothetical protein ETSY1_04430 [Candidatus Entotheonella factor]|uniref:Uncharacterized protein n=2 Tax=Candidatus Entotheonella TaxID=93171 RepID=W4LWD2_ENTF1|nr:MAG: hypothetical protein ETSY1_04430 [Candidatus Entotheonella factor]
MRLWARPAEETTVRRWGVLMLRHEIRLGVLIAVLAAGVCVLMACSEQFSDIGDALGDTADRIEESVLPPIVEETEVVLRNFVNFLPALLEICATPIGELGEFVSQLPELQRAQQQVGDTFTLDDSNGSWQVGWRDVVFGDQDGQLSVDAGTPSIDVTVTARFRNTGLGALRAVPFTLPSREFVQTSRESDDVLTCTDMTPEGFYLFQDQTTGVWTLGWCAQGTDKVFQGDITSLGISRVSRKLSGETEEEVASLTASSTLTTLEFTETAAPMVAEGIRFFVRPGEFIDFELRMGPAGSDPSSITREDLRVGADEAFLPSSFNPADFQLVTAVPIVPTGQPDFTQLEDFATFIWQDDMPGPCTDAGETLWRMRFHTTTGVTFSGFVALSDDDAADRRLRVFRVGRCQQGQFEFEDDNDRLNYECVVSDAADNGYDVCVRGARRLQFSPQVESLRDPTRVWIGGDNRRPPSQDPFTMFFEVEMEERQSARNLELTDGRIVLLGTTEEGGTVRINEDQVSLEARCRPLDDGPVHVRLIGEGEYATERFEGSRYDFEDLEFTNGLRTGDVSAQRLPNRGELELLTRDESDTVEIKVPASEFAETNGRVTASLDITLTLDTLELEFFDRIIDLSLE